MYTKILVPLDGSKLAEVVLPYASSLATSLQLPMDLLHVSDPETASRLDGIDYLQKVALSLPPNVSVRCRAESGAAAEVILDTASSDKDNLIAMATHGQSGGQRWLMGQVAQKVLHASANPLLLIRPQGKESINAVARFASIIVPLDGSRLAETILPNVVFLASRLNLAVVLIRIYTLPTAGYFAATGLPVSDLKDLGEKIKQEAASYLQAKAQELVTQGVERVSFNLAQGKGPEEIIDLAQSTANSLIAMCTHGRTGMGRWVMGSVADRVVSYSGHPVLLIRSTGAAK
jgi:nucleotide-binding universal stress UspA family protein